MTTTGTSTKKKKTVSWGTTNATNGTTNSNHTTTANASRMQPTWKNVVLKFDSGSYVDIAQEITFATQVGRREQRFKGRYALQQKEDALRVVKTDCNFKCAGHECCCLFPSWDDITAIGTDLGVERKEKQQTLRDRIPQRILKGGVFIMVGGLSKGLHFNAENGKNLFANALGELAVTNGVVNLPAIPESADFLLGVQRAMRNRNQDPATSPVRRSMATRTEEDFSTTNCAPGTWKNCILTLENGTQVEVAQEATFSFSGAEFARDVEIQSRYALQQNETGSLRLVDAKCNFACGGKCCRALPPLGDFKDMSFTCHVRNLDRQPPLFIHLQCLQFSHPTFRVQLLTQDASLFWRAFAEMTENYSATNFGKRLELPVISDDSLEGLQSASSEDSNNGSGSNGSNDGSGSNGSNDGSGSNGSNDGSGSNGSNDGSGSNGSNDGSGSKRSNDGIISEQETKSARHGPGIDDSDSDDSSEDGAVWNPSDLAA